MSAQRKLNLNNDTSFISLIKYHWVLIISMVVFLTAIVILYILSVKLNDGKFVYVLDDAYIHMSIAKNFAQNGVWGVTKYGFTSTSSSLLYTLVLALVYNIFGVNEIFPLFLNIFLAVLIILVVYFLLRKSGLGDYYFALVLLPIIFYTPLPALVFTGMEHVLQILLTILFVYYSARVMAQNRFNSLQCSLLFILAPMVTMVRYEGLFLILIVCLLFTIKGQFVKSLFLGSLAVLPIVLFGLISLSNHWFFLPNSILRKGNINILSIAGIERLINNFFNPEIILLVVMSVTFVILQIIKQKTIWREATIMQIIFMVITMLHIIFAKTRWFYRYEAYLVTLGIFVMAIEMKGYLVKVREFFKRYDKNLLIKYSIIAFFLLIISMPFSARGLLSLIHTPRVAHERYLEHVTPALFFKEYYQNETVVINDIGAISFFSNVRILDIYGLGSREPFIYKQEWYDDVDLSQWAKNENAAVAYLQAEWGEVYDLVPDEWILVESWRIPTNIVFGDTEFSWYATNKDNAIILSSRLRKFTEKYHPADILMIRKFKG